MSTPENLPIIKEVPVTDDSYEKLFKILLLGDSSVGKSSLFLSFMDKSWNETFVPTIGVDFKIKTINVNNMNIKFQVWDTAGQERFRTIISSYYKGAHGILLIFDLSDTESFDSLNNWLIEIERNANKNVIKILIGNKCDLEDKRKISFIQAKEFADVNGMKYIETSAKNDINVIQAFGTLGNELLIASSDKGIIQKDIKKNFSINNNVDLSKEKEHNNCCSGKKKKK